MLQLEISIIKDLQAQVGNISGLENQSKNELRNRSLSLHKMLTDLGYSTNMFNK